MLPTIVSSTSGHHDIQQVHDVVQEKDSYIAQLTRKLHKNAETISTLQKQLEQSIEKLRSSQKITGISYYYNQQFITLFYIRRCQLSSQTGCCSTTSTRVLGTTGSST